MRRRVRTLHWNAFHLFQIFMVLNMTATKRKRKPDRPTAREILGGPFVTIVDGWNDSPAGHVALIERFARDNATRFHKALVPVRSELRAVYYLPLGQLGAFTDWCHTVRADGIDGNTYTPKIQRLIGKLFKVSARVVSSRVVSNPVVTNKPLGGI